MQWSAETDPQRFRAKGAVGYPRILRGPDARMAEEGRQALQDRLGLSTSHTSSLREPPQISKKNNNNDNQGTQPRIELSEGGTTMRLVVPNGPSVTGRSGAKRGRCGDFNTRVRARMRSSVGELNRDRLGPGVMVALTYPDRRPGEEDLTAQEAWAKRDPERWHNWERWKRDLDCFAQRWTRRFPETFAYWKLEPQGRSTPHYHLVVFGLKDVSEQTLDPIREWASKAWWQVVGSGEQTHLRAGTRIKQIIY